jgi:UDP-N-acetylmuramate dehydrogenase
LIEHLPAGSAPLADHTTLRVGGPAEDFIVVDDADDLMDVIDEQDSSGNAVLLLGGGSNLVVADEGFPGTVVKVATRGIDVMSNPGGGVRVTVSAGESWDDVVARAVAEGWCGIECLSGIPGQAGSTPVQNVGAYGQEVAQTILRVQVYDRIQQVPLTLEPAGCRFGYRDSIFKSDPSRYVVLAVVFSFGADGWSFPIRYAELARRLGVEQGERAPVAEVREAVLELRRGKGMVSDPADHDTWSAGSFFTNPLLDRSQALRLPADAPRYEQADGSIKTSAAWLIAQSGFGKGYGNPPATLSTKHTLALTNRGGATTADILELAREIRAGVERRFGIILAPEPVLVGCSL